LSVEIVQEQEEEQEESEVEVEDLSTEEVISPSCLPS